MDKHMDIIRIDGSQGEGGGQVLRTSLTLSLLTQKPVEITHIRAKRKKPGLLRQHLTCVRAAQAICNGYIEGDELGSANVLFRPAKVIGGDYRFAIGSAGSTSLVCQTILLPLALADDNSTVEFEGGTHNGLSPSVTFLQWSFLPVLAAMGLKTTVDFGNYGFNPAGGGRWKLEIQTVKQLTAVKLDGEKAAIEQLGAVLSATAIVSQLPQSIAERELKTVANAMELDDVALNLKVVDSQGPGNSLLLRLQQGYFSSVFERVGEYGTSAERVAKRTIGKLRKLLRSNAHVEEHLADQILLPLLLAGGAYTTTQPTLHTTTNIAVIRQFTTVAIEVSQIDDGCWRVACDNPSVARE